MRARLGEWRAAGRKALQACVTWANQNRGATHAVTLICGGIVAVGVAIDTKADVAGKLAAAERSCQSGRLAYVRGQTPDATKYMADARDAITYVLDRVDSMSGFVRAVVLPVVGTSEVALQHLAAHINYHSAVLKIRNHQLREALEMLDLSLSLRDKTLQHGHALERARVMTRLADVHSWDRVDYATRTYRDVIDTTGGKSFFAVRAHNNFGILWYALGFDDRAGNSFAKAASLADELLGMKQVHDLMDAATKDDSLHQLHTLGSGGEIASPTAEVEALLNASSTSCGVVDVAHLQLWSPARAVEAAERLKLTWRKRVTARVNHLQLLATTWPPRSPTEVASVLADLAVPAAPSTAGVFHPIYRKLDQVWLLGSGSVRIAYGLVAGLTELLKSGAFDDGAAAKAHSLIDRAATIGRAHLADVSATHQGMFEYFVAEYLLLMNQHAEAGRYSRTAEANFGGSVASTRQVTQRDIRLRLQARLLHEAGTAESVEAALNHADRSTAMNAFRDITMRNPDHPLLLRLRDTSARSTPTPLRDADTLLEGLSRLLSLLESGDSTAAGTASTAASAAIFASAAAAPTGGSSATTLHMQ